MTSKKAILVVGPESSGNRLMTRLLVAAGCEGQGSTSQLWDAAPPTDQPCIVWLRSVPHGGEWPAIERMIRSLTASAYDVRVVVMSRDFEAQVRSQVRVGHVSTRADAVRHINRAYLWIFAELAKAECPYVLVTYEALCQRPEVTMTWLAEHLGLSPWRGPLPEPIVDGNAQYF